MLFGFRGIWSPSPWRWRWEAALQTLCLAHDDRGPSHSGRLCNCLRTPLPAPAGDFWPTGAVLGRNARDLATWILWVLVSQLVSIPNFHAGAVSCKVLQKTWAERVPCGVASWSDNFHTKEGTHDKYIHHPSWSLLCLHCSFLAELSWGFSSIFWILTCVDLPATETWHRLSWGN